jgi:hypothetical protein
LQQRQRPAATGRTLQEFDVALGERRLIEIERRLNAESPRGKQPIEGARLFGGAREPIVDAVESLGLKVRPAGPECAGGNRPTMRRRRTGQRLEMAGRTQVFPGTIQRKAGNPMGARHAGPRTARRLAGQFERASHIALREQSGGDRRLEMVLLGRRQCSHRFAAADDPFGIGQIARAHVATNLGPYAGGATGVDIRHFSAVHRRAIGRRAEIVGGQAPICSRSTGRLLQFRTARRASLGELVDRRRVRMVVVQPHPLRQFAVG